MSASVGSKAVTGVKNASKSITWSPGSPPYTPLSQLTSRKGLHRLRVGTQLSVIIMVAVGQLCAGSFSPKKLCKVYCVMGGGGGVGLGQKAT